MDLSLFYLSARRIIAFEFNSDRFHYVAHCTDENSRSQRSYIFLYQLEPAKGSSESLLPKLRM